VNVEVREVVDRLASLAVQSHTQRVSEARQADAAVGLHENVTCLDVSVKGRTGKRL